MDKLNTQEMSTTDLIKEVEEAYKRFIYMQQILVKGIKKSESREKRFNYETAVIKLMLAVQELNIRHNELFDKSVKFIEGE